MFAFLLLLFLLLPTLASAATLTATPGTLRSVLARTGPGDTVLLQQGTYAPITQVRGGTSWNNAPIIKAAPGAKPIVRGIGLQGPQSRYIIFQGLRIDAAKQGNEAVWISNGAGYIRIEKSDITGGRQQGALLPKTGAGHNQFLTVNVYDNGSRPHFHHGLYISSAENHVVNSQIYNNAGYGVHIYAHGEHTANRNRVWGNRIYNNGQLGETTYGLLFQDGTGNAAIGNTFSNNGTGDIMVGDRTSGTVLQDNQIGGRIETQGPVSDRLPTSPTPAPTGQPTTPPPAPRPTPVAIPPMRPST